MEDCPDIQRQPGQKGKHKRQISWPDKPPIKKQRANTEAVVTIAADASAAAAAAAAGSATTTTTTTTTSEFVTTTATRADDNVIAKLFTEEKLYGYIKGACAFDFFTNIVLTIEAANKDNRVVHSMHAHLVQLNMKLKTSHLLRSKELFQAKKIPDSYDAEWFANNEGNNGNCFVWNTACGLEPIERCHMSPADCLQYRTIQHLFARCLKEADRTTMQTNTIRSCERAQQDGLIYVLVTFLMRCRPGKFRNSDRSMDYYKQFMQLMETIVTIGGQELSTAHDEVVNFVLHSVYAEYNVQCRYFWRMMSTFSAFGCMSVLLRKLLHAHRVDVKKVDCRADIPENAPMLCAITNMYFTHKDMLTLIIEDPLGACTHVHIHRKTREFVLDLYFYFNPHRVLANFHQHTLLHYQKWKLMILLVHEKCINNTVSAFSDVLDTLMQTGNAQCYGDANPRPNLYCI
jgi:hypothetical protein